MKRNEIKIKIFRNVEVIFLLKTDLLSQNHRTEAVLVLPSLVSLRET